MPSVIAAVAIGAIAGGAGLAAFSAGVVAFFGGSAALAGAVIFGGLAAVSHFLTPGAKAIGTTGDVSSTSRASVMRPRWILGRARVGGYLVFYGEREDGRTADMAIVLGAGPMDAVERIWVNGEEITLEFSGNNITSPDYPDGQLEIWMYLAGDGQDGLTLDSAYEEWDKDVHRLTGKAWVHVKMTQPKYGRNFDNRVWNGLPRIEYLVRGLKFTWPDQATAAWTDNAAACRYWFQTQRRGTPAAAIDLASFRAAFWVCDELISTNLGDTLSGYNPTSKRYAIDGVVHADEDSSTIEAEMDFAWQGHVIEVNGILYFRPGQDRPVVGDVDETNIIEALELFPQLSLEERINAATMVIPQSGSHDWLPFEVPEVTDSTAMVKDGEKRSRSLGSRSFLSDPIAALRILNIQLKRARASAGYRFRIMPGPAFEAFRWLPTDRIRLTSEELGLKDKLVEIGAMTIEPDWSIIVLLSDAPDGLYNSELIDPPLLPKKLTVPTRTAPAAAEAVNEFLPQVNGDIGDDATFVGDNIASVECADGFTTVTFVNLVEEPYRLEIELQHPDGEASDYIELTWELIEKDSEGFKIRSYRRYSAGLLSGQGDIYRPTCLPFEVSVFLERGDNIHRIGAEMGIPSDPSGLSFSRDAMGQVTASGAAIIIDGTQYASGFPESRVEYQVSIKSAQRLDDEDGFSVPYADGIASWWRWIRLQPNTAYTMLVRSRHFLRNADGKLGYPRNVRISNIVEMAYTTPSSGGPGTLDYIEFTAPGGGAMVAEFYGSFNYPERSRGYRFVKIEYAVSDTGPWMQSARFLLPSRARNRRIIRAGDSDFVNGTTYYLRARLENPSDNSAWVERTVTTSGSAPMPPAQPVAECAPGDGKITITRPAAVAGVTFEWRYQAKVGGTWSDWTVFAGATVEQTGLTNGTAYTVEVRGRNSDGVSPSDSADCTPRQLMLPGRPTTTFFGESGRYLWRRASIHLATSVEGRYRLSGGEWSEWAEPTVMTSNGFDGFDKLAAGNYDVEVRGRNADGPGPAQSSTVTVT